MPEKIIEGLKKSGIFILMVIVNAILVTTVLFFFNITITKFHLPIIFILTIVAFVVLYRKDGIRKSILPIVIGTCIFILSIIIMSNCYDLTVDGNTYHKLAIGSLKNGWNPVYENSEDFSIEKGNIFNINIENNNNTVWTNHYTKGVWVFAANVYSFTGNIESGKAINILVAYVAFVLIFSYITKNKNWYTALIIALILVANPITIVQTFNYYIDGILGLTIFVLIYSLIAITNKSDTNSKIENYLVLACSIIICSNIKFTGLVFAGMFCMAFYIYWIFQNFKNNKQKLKSELIKNTIFYIAIVFISVFVVGFSAYVKNTFEHGHPFYPLFGEGKYDIITTMQPREFKEKGTIEKFLISIFSIGENVGYSEDAKPHLKIPFTFTKQEMSNYNIPDIRIGGFGVLFSGIFIITVIVTVVSIIDLIKNKKFGILVPYVIILSCIAILMLIVEGSWWARYIPYFYLVPVLSILYLLCSNNKFFKIAGILLSIIIAVNAAIIIYVTCDHYGKSYEYINKNLNEFKQSVSGEDIVKIHLNEPAYESVIYNLDDIGVKAEVSDNQDLIREGYFFNY